MADDVLDARLYRRAPLPTGESPVPDCVYLHTELRKPSVTLIPLGLEAARALFEEEVAAVAGPRYARHDGAAHRVRWGRQQGSIYLADQKLALPVPRVRDRQAGTEVPLRTYARL